MREMFSGCSSLKDLNISNFITDNVTNMSSMFSRCASLNDNVFDMSEMFNECFLFKELKIKNIKTLVQV